MARTITLKITLICRCEESLPIEEFASHIVPVLQELVGGKSVACPAEYFLGRA